MVVHDFVMEHREVESEAKSNWVASIEALGSFLSVLVVLESTVLDGFKSITGGAFSNVSIIVTDHLEKECLGLVGLSLSVALVLDNLNNFHALLVKLCLNFLFVLRESIIELRVFWVLLNGADGSNGSPVRTNEVLESNGHEVSLLGGKIFSFLINNFFKE